MSGDRAVCGTTTPVRGGAPRKCVDLISGLADKRVLNEQLRPDSTALFQLIPLPHFDALL